MKVLQENFATLQKDVDTLKEKEARTPTPPRGRRHSSSSSSSSGDESDRQYTRRSHHSRSRRPRSKSPADTRSRHSAGASSSSRQVRRSRRSLDRQSRSRRSPAEIRRSRSRRSPSPKGKGPLFETNWGLRMEGEPEEMNYDEPVEWPDSDEEEGSSSLVEVSEPTKRLLKTKFTVSLNNEKRKRAKGKFPKQPKVAAVKTPKLDDYLKQLVPAASKQAHKPRCKLLPLMR